MKQDLQPETFLLKGTLPWLELFRTASVENFQVADSPFLKIEAVF